MGKFGEQSSEVAGSPGGVGITERSKDVGEHPARSPGVYRRACVREKSVSDMFLGEFEHTIDAKGRLAVPAKFRVQMDRGAIISKGMGRCLSIYPTERWEEKSAALVVDKSAEELRDFERRIFPSASEVELDGQGRLVIPAKLREYARLGSEVTVTGVRDHIEIWDRASWREYQQKLDADGSGVPF